MSEANGQLLVSSSSGRILCHPSTGAPLYGITYDRITNCDPDLLHEYQVVIADLSVNVQVDWVSGHQTGAIDDGDIRWDGVSGSANVRLMWGHGYYGYWYIYVAWPGGGEYLYKDVNERVLCPGPVGAYTEYSGHTPPLMTATVSEV